MGGCQNYGPLLGPLNMRCRIILKDPKRDHNFDNFSCKCYLVRLLLEEELFGSTTLGADTAQKPAGC